MRFVWQKTQVRWDGWDMVEEGGGEMRPQAELGWAYPYCSCIVFWEQSVVLNLWAFIKGKLAVTGLSRKQDLVLNWRLDNLSRKHKRLCSFWGLNKAINLSGWFSILPGNSTSFAVPTFFTTPRLYPFKLSDFMNVVCESAGMV